VVHLITVIDPIDRQTSWDRKTCLEDHEAFETPAAPLKKSNLSAVSLEVSTEQSNGGVALLIQRKILPIDRVSDNWIEHQMFNCAISRPRRLLNNTINGLYYNTSLKYMRSNQKLGGINSNDSSCSCAKKNCLFHRNNPNAE
jgi:hypothetical protein